MRLVVTEKPSVARDLSRVLGARRRADGYHEGDGLRISWCYGHMAELEQPAHYDPAWKRWALETLPMVPERFDIKLRQGDDRFRRHWTVLKHLLREADEVINACDAGREGELIFRYVYQLAGCRAPTQRLWVSSLTDTAITRAWDDLRPGERYDPLAAAARCRSQADWLVGLNATRAMTCKVRAVGGDQLLSVGRVQTPTLAMITSRDKAIAEFVPETFWQVKAKFSAPTADGEGRWTGTFFQERSQERSSTTERAGKAPRGKQADPGSKGAAPKAERLSSVELAEAVVAAVKGRPGQMSTAARRKTTEKPPLLYDLTALQRRANQRYSMPAPRTLEIAQALYERHKLLTYPRTDARYITPDQVATLPGVVRGVGGLPVYAPFAEGLLESPIQPGKRVVNAAEVGDHHAILPTNRTPDPGRLSPDEKRIYDLVARRLLAALSLDAQFDVTVLVVDVAPEGPLPEELTAPLRFRARGRICTRAGWRAVDPPPQRKQVDLPSVSPDALARTEDATVHEGQTRPPKPHNDATLLRSMETAGRELADAELKRAMRSAGLGTPATRAAIIETLLRRQFITRDGRTLNSTPRGRALVDAVPVPDLKSPMLTGQWEARLAAIAEGRSEADAFMADVRGHLGEIIDAIKAAEPPPPERAPPPDTPVLGTCPVCDTPVREGRGAYSCETGRGCSFVIFKKIAKRNVSRRMVKTLLTKGVTPVLKGFRSRAGKDFKTALRLDDAGKVVFDFSVREPAKDETTSRGTVTGRGRRRSERPVPEG